MPKGKHRDTMVVKIPVDRDEVVQAQGSYQRLAGMYFARLKATQGAAIEATKEVLRLQAEQSRMIAQFAAQIEDHRAEGEVKDDEDDETAAAG